MLPCYIKTKNEVSERQKKHLTSNLPHFFPAFAVFVFISVKVVPSSRLPKHHLFGQSQIKGCRGLQEFLSLGVFEEMYRFVKEAALVSLFTVKLTEHVFINWEVVVNGGVMLAHERCALDRLHGDIAAGHQGCGTNCESVESHCECSLLFLFIILQFELRGHSI